MKNFKIIALIVLILLSLFGCKSEEQKRIELEQSAREWKNAADKAEALEGLLDDYKKAGGK